MQWLILLFTTIISAAIAQDSPNKYLLFVGTYTDKDSKGVYAYRFDSVSGELISLGVAAETPNPSFLAIDASHRYLYAVNELQTYQGAGTGAVSAFAIDHKTGKLSLLNQVASDGADPCYISFDKTGKYLLVANYTGGTVAVFPIQADGRLVEASSVLHDSGALGPNKQRQDAPHSHWIEASANNRYVYVSDLGLDRVLIYAFDAKNGTLGVLALVGVPIYGSDASKALRSNGALGLQKSGSTSVGDFPAAILPAGTGPRHIAFSADENFMYVLGELDSNVTLFAAGENNSFHLLQRISALPAGFSGHNDAAEIAIHPNGKYLYTSNRGDDSIAVFAIDGKAGTLSLVDRVSTQGKEPRNFEIDPSGKFLLVANQESNNIVIFRINLNSGKLAATGQQVQVPAPVDLKFMPQ